MVRRPANEKSLVADGLRTATVGREGAARRSESCTNTTTLIELQKLWWQVQDSNL